MFEYPCEIIVFFFQAEDGIRDGHVTGVQTCALPILVGEVDTYKKFPDYDLYGDFNVNYVKLERVPGFEDWSAINRALRAGEFFVTTGELLIPHWSVEGRGNKREVVADVEWTFPLDFVEVVWGDG